MRPSCLRRAANRSRLLLAEETRRVVGEGGTLRWSSKGKEEQSLQAKRLLDRYRSQRKVCFAGKLLRKTRNVMDHVGIMPNSKQ